MVVVAADTFATPLDHLGAELERLDVLLRREVLRLRVGNVLADADDFRGLYIPDAQVDALLARNGRRPSELDELGAHAAALRRSLDLRTGADLPLRRIARQFELSELELDALVVALAPELDLRYETLYAYVQNDVTRKRPTVDLVTRLLGNTLAEQVAVAALFLPGAPLVRDELVRVRDDPQERDPPLLARFVKADERLVDAALGRELVDARLAPFTTVVDDPAPAVPDVVRRGLPRPEPGALVLLLGGYGAGKRAAAAAACNEVGLRLVAADLRGALASELPLAKIAALLRREALLLDAGLYVGGFEAILRAEHGVERAGDLARALDRAPFPVFVGSAESWHPAGSGFSGRFRVVELGVPPTDERLRLWSAAVPTAEAEALEALAAKFALTPGSIADAARDAASADAARLHAAARAHSSGELRRLAQKIEPVYGWDDIVLPPDVRSQLREVCASLAYRHVVHERWGFGRRLALGRGLHVLFTGPSGTGKTMAADVVAGELGLDLFKIDLSTVLSKYIGETEERLRRIFDEAEATNAILFFDEADALFGKRSEVKDAHDRYANVEVAYLLQKLEEYGGVVILASNLSRNIDEAFARRMHHTVDFPPPSREYRRRIWERVFPPDAPLARDVDFDFLARQFELAGGHIRNIALAAAFRAAEERMDIGMEHLIRATAREYEKLNRLPSRAHFGEWFATLERP